MEEALSSYPFHPKQYPGKIPSHSYFLSKDFIHEIQTKEGLPISRSTVDFTGQQIELSMLLDKLSVKPLEDRYAVIGYGSNACPGRLVEKGIYNLPIFKVSVRDLDVVYAYDKTSYGVVPATIVKSLNTLIEIWVSFLDEVQLKKMDESEGRKGEHYSLVKMKKCQVILPNGTVLPSAYAYVANKKGISLRNREPIAVASIQAKNRKFESLAETDMLAIAEECDRGDSTDYLDFDIIPLADFPKKFRNMSEEERVKLSPGSIIKLRSRLWRVDHLLDKVLVATTIDGVPVQQRRFYLPFEKISLGKIEQPSPETVGNYAAQNLMLRAYRLSMIHGTAPLLSLQRSRALPVSYQMVPVVMSLEASRLLVVCPASLREQWKEALEYFFHIEARIISSRHRRAMERELSPGTNPWEYYPYLIASMDYAKKAEVKAQILEQKEWDIVLVDEAHNVAKPHQVSSTHRVKMERWEFMRDLAKKTRHLLLLTATPHNGYTDTFASLLRMLDVRAVSGPDHNPVIHREVARSYICQRRRKDVLEELKKSGEESPFPERVQKEVFVLLSEVEHKVIEKVEQLGKHILASAGPEGPFKMRIAKWTVTHFHKRALSSPRSLVCSLRNRLKVVEKRLQSDESPTGEEASITEEEARAEVLDNDPGERVTDEEAGARMERTLFGRRLANKREKELLELALREAQKITPARDNKLTHLLNNSLREMYRRKSKAIIFTKYKDTLDYLAEQIPKHKLGFYKDATIVTLHGSLNESQRKERFRKFEKTPRAIMVATDCISEGINLQYAASQVIHYELPWNPNRLEQRTGRVDRYGQPEKTVYVCTMVVDDSLEAAILKVLVRKAVQIREDHGFSPPFFGDDLSILDLIREQGLDVGIAQTKLDKFCEDISSQTPPNPFSDEAIQRMKNDNFYGQSDIDMSQVQKRLGETENLIGSQAEIQRFVKSGLNKFGCRITENVDGTFRIEVSDRRLFHGVDKTIVPRATFDPLRGRNDPDLDVVDLGYPLVRNLIELVKELTFASNETYGRTACVATDIVNRTSAVYTFLVRYAVQTQPVSIVEELLNMGLHVHGKARLSQAEVDSLSKMLPSPHRRTEEEMNEDLEAALSKPRLPELMHERAEERCRELAAERQALGGRQS